MRIIAGEFRGRQLLVPEGSTTRPITDRVKQSLFDILASRLDGAIIYDIFAGTGSLGLEALSRGASHCTFFEQDRSALSRLSQNIASLRLQGRCRIIPGDLFKHFQRANERPHTFQEAGRPAAAPAGPTPDVIFLDPPYRFLTDRPDELLQLALHLTHAHMKPDTLLVFRHDARDTLALPRLAVIDQRTYGDMAIELLSGDSARITI